MEFAVGNVKRKTYKGGSELVACTREKKTGERECHDQQLIPGLPDDLTIQNISTRLSWPVLNNLIIVSHGWLKVIRSRSTSEARRVQGSEKIAFVVRVNETMNGSEAIRFALYSVEQNSVDYLPGIPCITHDTIVKAFTYAAVNGKLFVLAALRDEAAFSSTSSRKAWRLFTYIYDLAGHIGWKKCADPEFARHPIDPEFAFLNLTNFESAVMDGKIVVYGYTPEREMVCGRYDPDNNLWSPMAAVIDFDQVPAKDLFYCGQHIHPLSESIYDITQMVPWLLIWVQDVLRAPALFRFTESIEPGIIIGGRFLKITDQGVDVYDSQTDTWAPSLLGRPFRRRDSLLWLDLIGRQRNIDHLEGIDVAVVQNTVFFLSVDLCHFQLHLFSREAVVRDSHLQVPLRAKFDQELRKSITLEAH